MRHTAAHSADAPGRQNGALSNVGSQIAHAASASQSSDRLLLQLVHELNNALLVIAGQSELAARVIKPHDALADHVRVIAEASAQAQAAARQIADRLRAESDNGTYDVLRRDHAMRDRRSFDAGQGDRA